MMNNRPLADRMRPQIIEEICGQSHLGALRKIAASNKLVNMIFFGPSGTGKTTFAEILAKNSNSRFFKLNATQGSTADIKEIIKESNAEQNVLLYLDEIQSFNKKQQQSLLEVIENGQITLIASTTENPYFYVYNALLSRCLVFEFKPLTSKDLNAIIECAIQHLNSEGIPCRITDAACTHLSMLGNGDARKVLNLVEGALLCGFVGADGVTEIDIEQVENLAQKKAFRHDRDGDEHYDILSAFQKSIRGSDVNAALHYLARLIIAGDLASIIRRLLVIAAEDIGMAHPQAIVIVKQCCDSALQVGLPEGRIPLSLAVCFLATCPKSNSAVVAIDAALSCIEQGDIGEIPAHLRDSHYSGAKSLGRGQGYQYPHDYPNNFVAQEYLPTKNAADIYYNYGNNKYEQACKKYWESVKGGSL